MSQRLAIHVGAVAPYSLEVVIGSEADGYDLTLVTAGEFELLRGSNVDEAPHEIWSADVSQQLVTEDGGTQITLTHAYVDGDLPEPGTIYFRAKLTHPDGPVYSRPLPLNVKRAF